VSTASASDRVAVELARADELARQGQGYEACSALWDALTVAPRDPVVLSKILDKVGSLRFQGAFERHRFDDPETAEATEQSVTDLVSMLERKMEDARKSRSERSFGLLGEGALAGFAFVAMPFYVAAWLGAQVLVALIEAVRHLLGRPDPHPSSRLARLRRWVEERNEAAL
jgi:hypothetical protein